MTQDDLPVTAASEIDAEEAAQYDRQIRLWGIGAQQRMRTSKVLVAGLRTLAAEVCKNIVLAGLGAVTLLDHEAVSEDDLCGNFFYGQDDLGRNSRVDSICRAHGVKFFCGDNFGYFGYIFADLGLQRFQAREGRLPHYGNKEDIESAVRDTGCVLTESGLAATLAPEESMRQLAQGACVGFSPVAAVVGGILGQEILKAVSAKDKPHNNFFFYDALTKSGTVETIG